MINQNFFYPTVFEPKQPNDVALFRIWKDVLVSRGVDLFLDTEVTEIHPNSTDDQIEWVSTQTRRLPHATTPARFYAGQFIFAMPPLPIQQIFQKNHLKTGFRPDFHRWAEATNYLPYIPVVFHWHQKIILPRVWGYPQTAWGVGYVVMSDYTNFDDPRSQTVISSLITIPTNPSDRTGLTPNDISDPAVLIDEVFRQLKTILGEELPRYDHAILSQNTYENGEWVPHHTAFMTTTEGHLPFHSTRYANLSNCGVQNGKSNYVFTSLESSVVNALVLVQEFIPESRRDIRIRTPTTFRFVFFWLVVSLLLVVSFRSLLLSILIIGWKKLRKSRR